MISEKKYKLEVEKLMKIINKLREERNLSLINYQKISSDILQFKKFIEKQAININDQNLKNEFEDFKKNFKNYF